MEATPPARTKGPDLESRGLARNRDTGLTDMQARFVVHFTTTDGAIGNKAEAARLAGYSERSAKEIGHQLINKPHVRAAIDDANQRQLSGPMASKAIARLDRILSDDTTPLKIMLDAIKTTLDRAGHIAPKAEERRDPDAGKHPADMSLTELEAVAAESRKRLMSMRDTAVTPAAILESAAIEEAVAEK